MAAQIPIKVLKDGSDNTCGLAQFSSSDNLPVSVGGTGLTTQGICAFAQPGINAVACKSTYIGICAGKSEGAADENTYVGYAAGQNVTTGCFHTIIGSNAGDAITTCHSSVLIGYNAGTAITFGDFNTLIGTTAGAAVVTASNNTAVGYSAATATICSNNVAVGTCAMVANTQGQDNVAIGLKAGATQVAAGCNNVFIGSCVGAVALCQDNTLVGTHAGIAQTTATGNVMLGVCVGYGVVGGGGNVYLGYKSGLVNTSGNNNVFIGNCAGVGSTASCCLIIGNGTCDLITGDFNTPLISMVGCVGIGTTAPDGTLHAFTASAGSVTAIATGDDLIVENSDHTGITILSPNDKQGGIYFADPDDNDVGQIYYQHATDAMTFYTNAAARMTIDCDGAVTQPNLVWFAAYNDTVRSDVTGDGTIALVCFNNETAAPMCDPGGNFNGTCFIAPVAGVYAFHATVKLSGLDSGHDYYYSYLNFTDGQYFNYGGPWQQSSQDSSDGAGILSLHHDFAAVYMDAADIAMINVNILGSGQTVDIAAGNYSTYFQGHLVG